MQQSALKLEEYWLRYLEANPQDLATGYSHYYFCDNESDAKELSELVISGKKRATTSLLLSMEREAQPLPKPGDYNIITDYYDVPQCIVKTVKVDTIPFKDVSEEYAGIEGEGDGSLSYWRSGHIRFFTRECERIGMCFSEDMKVVRERFEVVFV